MWQYFHTTNVGLRTLLGRPTLFMLLMPRTYTTVDAHTSQFGVVCVRVVFTKQLEEGRMDFLCEVASLQAAPLLLESVSRAELAECVSTG